MSEDDHGDDSYISGDYLRERYGAVAESQGIRLLPLQATLNEISEQDLLNRKGMIALGPENIVDDGSAIDLPEDSVVSIMSIEIHEMFLFNI